MKRIFTLTLCCLLLCACAADIPAETASITEKDENPISTSEVTASSTAVSGAAPNENLDSANSYIGENLKRFGFVGSVERFNGRADISQDGMTSAEAAELLIDKHIVCCLTYRGDSLIFPENGDLVKPNHYIFGNSYSAFESFVRSTYEKEIAEDVLYAENQPNSGIYKCGENDVLLLDIAKQGIGIFPPSFSEYKLKVLSETEDSMEFAVTWERYVDIYKAIRQDGEWRLCDITPLNAIKYPADEPVFDVDLSRFSEVFKQGLDPDFEDYSELVCDMPGSRFAVYLGNEKAEWILPVTYGFENAQFASYVRMFRFIGGELAGTGAAAALNPTQEWYRMDDARIYTATTVNGLAIYDTISDSYSFITEDDEGNVINDKPICLFGKNDDYVIFGNGCVFAYKIKSGEVFRLENVNLCLAPDEYSSLRGNRLLYLQTYPWGIKSGIYDLEKREYYPLESFEAETAAEEEIPENICYHGNLSAKIEVNNGVKRYSTEGLSDGKMKEQIDKFINESFSELDKFIAQDNLSPVLRCDIINGYLSVVCGYTDGVMPEMGALSRVYVCRTAVFDIIEGKKIESFDELFPEDFDLCGYEPPDHFTAVSYFAGMYEYPFLEHWNIRTLVLEPRDFSDYVTTECTTAEQPLFYTSMTKKQYKNDILASMYVVGSRFLSENEIQEKNRIYEIVENAMYDLFDNNREEAKKHADNFNSISVEEVNFKNETYYVATIGAFNEGSVTRMFRADGSAVYLRDIAPDFTDREATVNAIYVGDDGSAEVLYSTDEFSFDGKIYNQPTDE